MLPKLLEVIIPFLVVVSVKAGGIVQRVRSIDQNMTDFVGQDEPPTAVFGRLLQKGIQNNRIFGVDNADTLVIPLYIQRVRAIGKIPNPDAWTEKAGCPERR